MIDRTIILKDYNDGLTLTSIGRKFNVSTQRISMVLQQMGVAPRKRFYFLNEENIRKNPTRSEKYVFDILSKKYETRYKNTLSPYDLEIKKHNHWIKIEVKERKTKLARIETIKIIKNAELLIVLINNLKNNYVIPTKRIKSSNISLSSNPKYRHKYMKYYNRLIYL